MSVPSYPQQNWPPPGPPDRPQRRRAGVVVAVVLAVVAVLAVGVNLVVVNSNSASAPVPIGSPAPTVDTAKKVNRTATRTDPTKATTPTHSRKSAKSTRSATTTRKANPADALQRNILYRTPALKAADCADGAPANLGSVAGVRAYYGSVMPCLTAAWSQLRGSKIPVEPAKLVVHSGENVSSCGARAYSFYCAHERTIYMYAPEMITPWLQYQTAESHRITRLAALHTIAHEYGHHIQHLTGMMDAVGTDWAGTEAERRLELQATCLGNAFLSSQHGAYPISSGDFAQQDLWRFITRVPNHGSVSNQKHWSDRGYQTAKPASCNTFSAPRAEVA